MLEIIYRAVNVKAGVVTQDFRESFEREVLNYGHTLGHAIERHSRYQLRHGEAISLGMLFAAELSADVAGLERSAIDLHRRLLAKLELPLSYPAGAWPELYELMGSDKKRKDGVIRFVTLPKIGITGRDSSLDSQRLESIYLRSIGG